MAKWGRIDAVVNSAGHGPKGPLLEISDADWQLGMEFYLLNVVRITRGGPDHAGAAVRRHRQHLHLRHLRARSAVPDLRRVPRRAAFTKVFSDEYAAHNVRMNNVLPGFIDSLPEKEERRSRIPMGRYGTAQEVADLIAFLASDASSYITGQNIRIDGGITRSV